MFVSLFYPFAASSGGGSTESLTSLLSMATELFTWFISSMTSLVSFIFAHPLVLFGFLIFICGSVVAMFMRIFHSA